MQLQHSGGCLDLAMPVVMGIVNVTPDSFSDGGRHATPATALEHALRLLDEGAGIIDIGGESTRPGAAPVSVDEELRRVVPVVEQLARRTPALISVDTSAPEVMRRCVAAGAGMINDVRALTRPGALAAAADTGAALCLMHMQGDPASMQNQPHYTDVVTEVLGFLRGRVSACATAGIAPERLCLDPGFGFGKNLHHNLALLAGLPRLGELGLPVVVGLSRKRMAAELSARPDGDRLAASLALATVAVLRGAHIVRTHDVAATVDAVRVAARVRI